MIYFIRCLTKCQTKAGLQMTNEFEDIVRRAKESGVGLTAYLRAGYGDLELADMQRAVKREMALRQTSIEGFRNASRRPRNRLDLSAMSGAELDRMQAGVLLELNRMRAGLDGQPAGNGAVESGAGSEALAA
jgi:hypothetical protein